MMSNCVINLSPDKFQVFQEAYRVLKAGGRLAISDVVATAELPEKIKNDRDAWSGCIFGASSIDDLESMLRDNGFTQITIGPRDESKTFIKDWAPTTNMEDYIVSAIITGVKP